MAQSATKPLTYFIWFHPTGHHECEIYSGRLPEAAESGFLWDNCDKNPGHTKFIPVPEFSDVYLPRSLSEEQRQGLDAIINLTVRLRISRTSRDRPDNDELSEIRGSDKLRLGTGIIRYVSIPQRNKPCPCIGCCGKNVKKFWKFTVQTAHHVVFNTEEATRTRVDLFYDSENSRKDKTMKSVWASQVRDVGARSESDVCSLECVTCNEQIGEKIKSLHRRWFSLYDSSEFSITSPPKELSLVDRFRNLFSRRLDNHMLVVSHPHGQPKMITIGKVTLTDSAKLEEALYVEYQTPTCPGSSGAPVLPLYPDRSGSLVLRCLVWGFVHNGGYDRSSTAYVNQVNYGNYWI